MLVLVEPLASWFLILRKRDVYKGCPVTFKHLPNPYEYICKVKEPWDNLKKEEEKTLKGTKGWRFPKLFLVGNLFFYPSEVRMPILCHPANL